MSCAAPRDLDLTLYFTVSKIHVCNKYSIYHSCWVAHTFNLFTIGCSLAGAELSMDTMGEFASIVFEKNLIKPKKHQNFASTV